MEGHGKTVYMESMYNMVRQYRQNMLIVLLSFWIVYGRYPGPVILLVFVNVLSIAFHTF